MDVQGTGDDANRGGLVKRGGNVAVLTHGDVWLDVEGSPAVNGGVYVLVANGQLTATDPTGLTQIPGANVRLTGAHRRDLGRAASTDTDLTLVRFHGGEQGTLT